MPPKPRRQPQKPKRRLAVRVLVMLVAVMVFAAFWLFDTVALLHFIRFQIARHTWTAVALAALFALALIASAWRARQVKPRRKVSRKH